MTKTLALIYCILTLSLFRKCILAEVNSTTRQLQPPLCGISNARHNRIVGGSPAARGAWPWIAALGVQLSGNRVSFFCGAALVTNRHIITAAHCLEERAKYVVRLGAHFLRSSNDGGIDYPIERVSNHPGYKKATYENDISVLRTRTSVQFTNRIRPICLPFGKNIRNRDLTGTTPFVAGWGATVYEGPTSNVLREVQLPVVSTTQCRRDYGVTNSAIDSRNLCAGYPQGGKDSCQGDSGGPLMLPNRNSWYLIGVVSSGYKCAAPGYPGIYTRVTSFLNFIKSHLN